MVRLEQVDAELDALGVDPGEFRKKKSRGSKEPLDLQRIDEELERLTTLSSETAERVSERPSIEIIAEPAPDLVDFASVPSPEPEVPARFKESVDQAIDEIFADQTISEPPASVEIAPSPTLLAPTNDPFDDEGTHVLDADEFEEFDGEILSEDEDVLVKDGSATPPAITASDSAGFDFDIDLASSRPPPARSSEASVDLDVDSWLAESTGTLQGSAPKADETTEPESVTHAEEDDPSTDDKPKGFFKKMFGKKK